MIGLGPFYKRMVLNRKEQIHDLSYRLLCYTSWRRAHPYACQCRDEAEQLCNDLDAVVRLLEGIVDEESNG